MVFNEDLFQVLKENIFYGTALSCVAVVRECEMQIFSLYSSHVTTAKSSFKFPLLSLSLSMLIPGKRSSILYH